MKLKANVLTSTRHTREETVTSNWMESKTIGTSQSDTIPRYCVREDGLSIINARKITDAKFAIKIQDYDTGEIKFDLPVSKRNIKEVKISADGNWLAFLMHISQVHTWEVYDKNGLKRLQFKKDKNVTPDWKSNILEFLPLEFIPFKNQPIVAQLITVDGRKEPLVRNTIFWCLF
ncbi:hypothetical protein TrispH2_012072 [Trichoplax sp. H2]|nr:hypothetical protein TrispH2_012072 [Trichoplax sp. H2]|eukprot:RDD35940.1 hypothetical protein TrispH2_012072 [Trichoplax sp. H2]